jgi:hypothetical protein
VVAWRGTAIEGVDGCLFQDDGQGINRLITGLAPAVIEACALEVAALGEAAGDSFCAVDLASCQTDANCASIGLCSVDGNSCQSAADCPSPIGTCTQDPSFCQTDDDCVGFLNLCQGFQDQVCGSNANTCTAGTPSCLDECFPPECGILPTLGVIEFTQQQFDSVYGLLSELHADADFSRAMCDPILNTGSWVLPPHPIVGDGQYFLLRAVEGVSCTDHGDSTLVPDPRDAMDASCP